MRLHYPRITPLRLMVALDMIAVIVWMGACLFAGLDDEEAAACVFLGIFCGFPALGIFTAFFLLMASYAFPIEQPPRDSPAIARPQFKIRGLMLTIALAALVLAFLCYA